MSVIEQIRQNYPNLSKAQKRIADYLIESPDEACFLSLKELSERVHTTEVTIMNFTHKIGFESFVALKKALQAYISMRLSPSRTREGSLPDCLRESATVATRVYDMDMQAIKKTFDCLSQTKIERAVDLIKGAKRVYLVAQRLSQVITDFLYIRLQSLGVDVVRFDLDSYELIANQMLSIRPDDVFILVAFPRYSDRVLFLGELLQHNGNKVVSITDRMTSPAAKYAEVVFACANDTLVFCNSLAAPLVLTNMLVSSLAVALEDRYLQNKERLREFEAYRQNIIVPPYEPRPEEVDQEIE